MNRRGNKTRKDSTRFVDTLVTASPEFFKGKSPKEIQAFFNQAADFLVQRVGKENIVSAVVHMDEKTPYERRVDSSLYTKMAGSTISNGRWDDCFIITADSKEIAEDLKLLVSNFLQSRGLQLSEEKTSITHIDNGFDFLGWNFRKFKGKIIVKPWKDSVKRVIRKLSDMILKESKASTQETMIGRQNLVIRGWSNYHKHTVASKAFSNVNNTLYLLLQRWAKHRHPNLQITKNPFLDRGYFINTKRIHSHCGYMSPNDFENLYTKAQMEDLAAS